LTSYIPDIQGVSNLSAAEHDIGAKMSEIEERGKLTRDEYES